jgi:hypothetical protein
MQPTQTYDRGPGRPNDSPKRGFAHWLEGRFNWGPPLAWKALRGPKRPLALLVFQEPPKRPNQGDLQRA